MGIGHIFIIWILSASLQPPYSSVDPTGLVVPIALITLLNRNAEIKTSTTTTSTATTMPSPSEATTNIQSTTMGSNLCIICERLESSFPTFCGIVGCDNDLTTGRCATRGDGPPVNLTCGQIEDPFFCSNLFRCSLDANAGTCGPSDQDITCSQIAAGSCDVFGADCCEVVDSECVEV